MLELKTYNTEYYFILQMRGLLAFGVLGLVCAVLAADSKAEEPKTWSRTIPADQLRDFPGLCFASTKCATIEPGQTWDLTPFCGRATCTKAADGKLLEVVDECRIPKENPKCKLNEKKTNKTAPYPACCPVIECEAGVKLEYPDIPAADAPKDKKA